MTGQEIWNTFCAKQELESSERDQYDRFPYGLSKHDVSNPIVSKFLVEKGFQPSYPNGAKMAVVISHDIDLLVNRKWPLKTILNQQVRALIKGNFKQYYESKSKYKSQLITAYSLKNILGYLKSRDIQSSTFFLSLEEGERDFNYSLVEVQDEIEFASKNGFEIGLHGGHTAYKNIDHLQREKKRILAHTEARCIGYRNHYLRFQYPNTLRNLASAGFEYDSTFGFAERIGFRNGMCFPFKPYDSVNEEYLDIVEIPLMAMDDTLFRYMNLNYPEVLANVKDLVQQVKSLGGVFTLLWHNDSFSGERKEAFTEIIDYLENENVWFATNAQLVDWYKQHNYFDEIKLILDSTRS